MNWIECSFVHDFVRMCEDGWIQGWHERNGGNLSYQLREEDCQCLQSCRLEVKPWVDIGLSVPELAGSHFLVTGSGKYFRNVKDDIPSCVGILEINEDGSAYRIVAGLEQAGPTSEFPTHFLCHGVRSKVTRGRTRVVYHAHVPYLIAMTKLLPIDARSLSRALWKAESECPVVFPEGVGFVPWMIPGGVEIAIATAKNMEEFQAVAWAHHGLFCTGADFDETFGLMHTIEKAAQIWILANSAGMGTIRQCITDQMLLDIAKAFGVELRKDFLDL